MRETTVVACVWVAAEVFLALVQLTSAGSDGGVLTSGDMVSALWCFDCNRSNLLLLNDVSMDQINRSMVMCCVRKSQLIMTG